MKDLENLIEEMEKVMKEKGINVDPKESEVKEHINVLLDKGFNALLVATDKGQAIYGSKLDIMATLSSLIYKLLTSGAMTKKDIAVCLDAVLTEYKKDQNKGE